MKKLLATALCTIWFGLSAHQAHSAVVVSNLDPGNAVFGFNAPEIGQSILIGNRPIALTSVEILQIAGLSSGETFSVDSRNADGSVGSPVFAGFTVGFDSTTNVTTATVRGSFTLQANTGYYFVLDSGATSNIEWSYTSSTDYASAFGATLPATRTSFDRVGTTTSYFNLSDGPQAFQVNGIAAAAVPEPSTWAMVLGGVGLLGVMLRRHSQVS